MATWRCPHCGTPQAETARCWVCRRSSTTCSTCRHFRASLAADVGYCSKDRWRTPLTGLELRACWEEGGRAAASGAGAPATAPAGADRPSASTARGGGGPLDRPNPMRLRGFVPLDELPATTSAATRAPVARTPDAEPAPPPPRVLADAADDWERRVSLFGELEA